MNSGLGTNIPNSSLISTGVSVVGGTVAGVAATTAGASALASIGIASSVIPFIGPVIAGVTLLIAALGIGNGCGATCTEATTIANNAELAFQQNLAAGQQAVKENGCLSASEQQQLEDNFQTIYQNMIAGCQQIPAPGGPACVKARIPGGQYDSVPSFLTPLQQMPVCSPVQNLVGSLGGISPIMLIGGGLLALWALSD